MKKLRAAVVGVGYLGNFHAQKYKNNSTVDLVGIYDSNPSQVDKMRLALQVGSFDKLQDLVGKVDLVTIASTTQSHFEVAEFLIQNGIHVNIEKPITVTTDQARKLVELAQEKKVKLAVGHVERFNPAFQKWSTLHGKLKYIESERMGPFKVRGTDVSVIHDLMIHDLDLLLSLKLGKVISLGAQGAKVMSETLDWASAWLEFESGVKCFLKASRVSPVPLRQMRALDEKNQWLVNFGTNEVEKVRYGGGLDTPLVLEQIQSEKVDGLQVETDAFIDSVRNNKACLITGEDGLAALELVERIQAEIEL